MKKLWGLLAIIWAVTAAISWWQGQVGSAIVRLLACVMFAIFWILQAKCDTMGEKGEKIMKVAKVCMLVVVLVALVVIFFELHLFE